MEEKLNAIAENIQNKINICDEMIKQALSVKEYAAAAKFKERKTAYEDAIFLIATVFF